MTAYLIIMINNSIPIPLNFYLSPPYCGHIVALFAGHKTARNSRNDVVNTLIGHGHARITFRRVDFGNVQPGSSTSCRRQEEKKLWVICIRRMCEMQNSLPNLTEKVVSSNTDSNKYVALTHHRKKKK